MRSRRFEPIQHGQIIFHGINKSGSLALSTALRAGYKQEARLNQFFSRYLSIPEHERDFHEIILNSSGHAFFVDHEIYGAIPPAPHRALVTILRHPLPRIFSVYRWLERHHSKDYGSSMPGFIDWVRNTNGITYSQLEQFGAGYGPKMHDLRKLPGDELLERAKQALANDVHCLGLAERFEETIFLFAHLCGLSAVPAWKRDDRNSDRPLVSTIDKSDLDLVEEVFHRDFELYKFAVELFEKQLKDIRFHEGELDRYKKACIGEYKDRLI
ncbi:hypothetical protein [Aminobacter sp. LjRoot7]|uniref:hypothetical protein n=1 Tax=Aminobacter sp. LjRoot7 TaxID=3342335 RepID=UPI003F4FC664